MDLLQRAAKCAGPKKVVAITFVVGTEPLGFVVFSYCQ